MQRQHCQYAVNRLLEKIGDENVLLQCDGYESFLNALKKCDTEGQIRELISPGDCTDLCSMPDCDVGAFVKNLVDKEFEKDYKAKLSDYITGKVTARQMRTFYTHAVAKAVRELYTNHKDMVVRAFQKTGVMIDLDGYEKQLIKVPRFDTYEPPEKDEPHEEEDLTPEEIDELEKKEIAFQKALKKTKAAKRKTDQITRNKKRAKRSKI